MLSVSDLRKDTLIQVDGIPFRIVEYQHTQLGRGGAIAKTKLKNLVNGTVLSKTFKGNEKIEPAEVQRVDMQYLFKDSQHVNLMDTQTYEQYSIDVKSVNEGIQYIPEGSTVIAFLFEGRIVGLDLPPKIKVKVISTEPAVKGDTAKAALKPAKLETGVQINVPLFIQVDQNIKVDTRSGQYIERA